MQKQVLTVRIVVGGSFLGMTLGPWKHNSIPHCLLHRLQVWQGKHSQQKGHNTKRFMHGKMLSFMCTTVYRHMCCPTDYVTILTIKYASYLEKSRSITYGQIPYHIALSDIPSHRFCQQAGSSSVCLQWAFLCTRSCSSSYHAHLFPISWGLPRRPNYVSWAMAPGIYYVPLT